MNDLLTPQEKNQLLALVRERILSRTRKREEKSPDLFGPECGVFVTLHKQGRLRGCIGFITSPQPLSLTVWEAAESAAFKDPRFPPVTADEVDELEIEISVLTPFEKIESTESVRIGIDGVYLKLGFQSGLFLPQVATEQGWDRETFLNHLDQKAGLPVGSHLSEKAELSRFQAVIFSETQ